MLPPEFRDSPRVRHRSMQRVSLGPVAALMLATAARLRPQWPHPVVPTSHGDDRRDAAGATKALVNADVKFLVQLSIDPPFHCIIIAGPRGWIAGFHDARRPIGTTAPVVAGLAQYAAHASISFRRFASASPRR